MTKTPMSVLAFACAGVCGGLLLGGCNKNQEPSDVVAQHYVHKYGYAVSQEEWESQNCPGQVISLRQDGVTVTATYEGGVLHGPTIYTFPHSQAVQKRVIYKDGVLSKEIFFNSMGMPTQEKIQLSPSRYLMTLWYDEGTPMLIEEWMGSEILEGQYFSLKNEVDAQIDKGEGLRIVRDPKGVLISNEWFVKGHATRKETFHPNGVPQSVSHFNQDRLEGERLIFSFMGEPVSIEEYRDDLLHGKATYYSNGNKVSEIFYIGGKKTGIERHYIDGEIVFEEIAWDNDVRHGPTIRFLHDIREEIWFYEGMEVSKKKFEDSSRLDTLMTSGTIIQ